MHPLICRNLTSLNHHFTLTSTLAPFYSLDNEKQIPNKASCNTIGVSLNTIDGCLEDMGVGLGYKNNTQKALLIAAFKIKFNSLMTNLNVC